jgi:DNA processing protein
MTQIEIWLRLAQVNELYGDEMVRIAHWLNTQPSISNAVLLQAGFSPARQGAF